MRSWLRIMLDDVAQILDQRVEQFRRELQFHELVGQLSPERLTASACP